jgi:Flp pilus assembly protein TadG
MFSRPRGARRRGTILPLLAVCVVALFALVALAVDLGMIMLARNHCQNAADVAAMSGVRVLNGDTTIDNNKAAAAPAAQAVAVQNLVTNQPITAASVSTQVGYYSYNTTLSRFEPNFSGTKPAGENWSAVQTTVTAGQPLFFAKVFGYGTWPVSATATAVHRPRDIAILLDFSTSMGYGSETAYPPTGTITGSLNPDPVYPKFGHWSAMSGVMQKTSSYVESSGDIHSPNNQTMETSNGPPVVQDFLTRDASGNLINAFYRPTTPYAPNTWAIPAPDDFDVQSSTTAPYVGDRWPRMNGSLTSGPYAHTVQEYVANNNTTQPNSHAKNTTFETNGYGASFAGYSMGPGSYGKTFYVWPPDPRPANDWRKKFFYNGGTTTALDDNSRLWDTSGNWQQGGSTTYTINYNAVVAWLTSGPKVLPDNLRAGRVLYYSAIPTSIPTSGGTADQVFWRNYIDYVIGNASASTQKQQGYGRETSAWGTAKITPKSSLSANPPPYMHYNDNPIRPRMQFWFGPLSMMAFLQDNVIWPGTCHQSQCWHLKAGIQSALSDIEKNHPNDWAALIYFSGLNAYVTPRVTLGRQYTRMKNALYFPYSMLDSLSDANAETRPYDTSWNMLAAGDVPNANGYTAPEMAFMVAYNQFSNTNGAVGRKGATKVVIFETDGVPNTPATGSFSGSSGNPYASSYTNIAVGSYAGNNNATVVSRALAAVDQLCAMDTASSPGFSTKKVPVRVHALGFGDLFESGSTQETQARTFLLQVQQHGNTSAASATAVESYKIITGDYNTRIDLLRQALEHIMQSGVQVSLIR